MQKRNEGAVYISLGLTLGAGLGITLGAVFDIIVLGLTFGSSLGLIIGVIIFAFKNK